MKHSAPRLPEADLAPPCRQESAPAVAILFAGLFIGVPVAATIHQPGESFSCLRSLAPADPNGGIDEVTMLLFSAFTVPAILAGSPPARWST